MSDLTLKSKEEKKKNITLKGRVSVFIMTLFQAQLTVNYKSIKTQKNLCNVLETHGNS